MPQAATFDAWYAAGERIPIRLRGGGEVHLFRRVIGDGPWVTFLHGFPTCSWDWAGVTDALAHDHRLLLPDLLGYGDSDKPAGHHYSLLEQADLLEALWRAHDIQETALVSHDIGVSIAQELLARRAQCSLSVDLRRIAFFNGALYNGVSKPRLMQRMLARRTLGPLLARVVTERQFTRTLASVFSNAHPLAPDAAHQYWLALRRRSAKVHLDRLLGYIAERARHHLRWEDALETTDVRIHLVWGMRDPVSGAATAQHVQARIPKAPVDELDDVGHYPHVEATERAATALGGFLRTSAGSA